MADEGTEQRSFPVERYPEPVCRYTFDDGTPVVSGVNPAFESQFDTVSPGTPLSAGFDALDITAVDTDDLARSLASGEQFSVAVDGSRPDSAARRYSVRTVPPEDGCGFLVFTPTAERELGVDHVASVVSHDLRNPLDVAKARLKAGRELDEDEHFEHVAQAHERMERIIQDVLTLARGEDVVEPDEAVALGPIAETAWETVETDDATLTVAEPLPTAMADPDRVRRLFENLFRNSIEHGATDPVHVTIGRLDGASEDGFYVADDGVGIPDVEQQRVFEPGYSSNSHGTGLGLAIVARIADLHDWSSAVTTAADGGARFEIRDIEPVELSVTDG